MQLNSGHGTPCYDPKRVLDAGNAPPTKIQMGRGSVLSAGGALPSSGCGATVACGRDEQGWGGEYGNTVMGCNGKVMGRVGLGWEEANSAALEGKAPLGKASTPQLDEVSVG